MRISFCPTCKKAGLRYERISVRIGNLLTEEETQAREENNDNLIKGNKWCPRCKAWVKPTNQEI